MHTHTSKLSSPYKIHMSCEMQLWDYSPLAVSEDITENRLRFALVSTWVKTNRARQSPKECRGESILPGSWTDQLLLHSLAEHSTGAWGQGSTSLLPEGSSCDSICFRWRWNAHTKTHVQEVNLKSNLYCLPISMFLFHAEKPHFTCLKFLSLILEK